MRKFLVVGCGGSGGATLTFMMDQLKSDLAAHGVSRIPTGWQFVHIDVPSAPSRVEDLENVRDRGGVYVPTRPSVPGYEVLDNAISAQLIGAGALDKIGTWAPREPKQVTVPLSEGAGQYRALGRMITLGKSDDVIARLQRAWQNLHLTETEAEMRALSIPGAGSFDPSDKPVVLVVSSMAGGAGASMALDVCRILTMVNGVDPALIAVFMVAPNIFEGLSGDAVTGVRANALAMLGEIVASQTGSARDHDVELLRALGLDNGEGAQTPFARVFPVGLFVGAERTRFGDGTPMPVYRGLGRGLSAMVLSASATQQFVEYDLTNKGRIDAGVEYLGWGNETPDTLAWGTFGFASLSMGRDRYAEYAAQRLARSSVDTLLGGHRQPNSHASDEDQVNAILENQWGVIAQQLGLPERADPSSANVSPWLTGTVMPRPVVDQWTDAVVNGQLRPVLPQSAGITMAEWSGVARQRLFERREDLKRGAHQAANRQAFQWQQLFVDRLERATSEALAQLGMPYATGLVKRVRRHLKDVVLPGVQELARYIPPDVSELPAEVQPLLASKGTLNSTAEVTEKVLTGTRNTVAQHIYATLAGEVQRASVALLTEVFDPLIAALDEKQQWLSTAAATATVSVGLADLRTSEYGAWPSESDEKVAKRFSEANNEVMLTSSAEFMQRYAEHLPPSVGLESFGAADLTTARGRAVQYVVTGEWERYGGRPAPAEERAVIVRVAEWRSAAFPRHPETGAGLIAQAARYDVHVRPEELLDRARAFVARTGQEFDKFTSVSLREYVIGAESGGHATEQELVERRRDLVIKFSQALDLARPLASVNETAMAAIHTSATKMEYRYKFSAVPFLNLPTVDDLLPLLHQKDRIDARTQDTLIAAMSDEAKIRKIDIFGSYPNYSPLAYDLVIEPAAKQWQSLAAGGQRKAFWNMRRSRPLAAALPMHTNERRTLVAGWVLGRAIGFIHTASSPFSADTPAAQVWDTDAGTWLEFPHPLLTPPVDFRADYDWLPAVLEGVLIAIARSHQPPVMASMRPYRALRRIYDTSEGGPASGLQELAAKSHLTHWLRSGTGPSGMASPIADIGPEVSVDERSQRLIAWLEQFGALAGVHYMKPGEGGRPGEPGAPGGGTFASITSRAQASQTPIFRDVAPDVWWATRELLKMVPECTERAKRPESSGGPIPPTTPTTPAVPSAGTFQIPDGGGF